MAWNLLQINSVVISDKAPETEAVIPEVKTQKEDHFKQSACKDSILTNRGKRLHQKHYEYKWNTWRTKD